MDSPTERMPIACLHCAKAKAKCDKKVPCSRCVSKQIVCQSRATRRSSHNPNRRSHVPRPNSERAIHASASFQVSQLSHFATPIATGNDALPNDLKSNTIPPHRLSLSESSHPVPIAPAIYGTDMDSQILRNGFTQTPPDLKMPITPMLQNMAQMDNFIQMHGTPYDHEGDNHFLAMSSAQPSMIDFDSTNVFADFMSPPQGILHDPNDQFLMSGKMGMRTPNYMPLPMPMHDGSAPFGIRLDMDYPQNPMQYQPPVGLSPSNSSTTSGLQEPDAVLAAHYAWPFFQCNRVEKYSFAPPKSAGIYLEGLAQTLRNQATWTAWTAQLDESFLDISTERKIASEPIVGWSREKLLAITQGFLHKALDIHKAGPGHGNREETPSSPDSSRDAFLMLPPPDVMQYFLRSYVVRYEPYYPSVSGGRLDPNALMQSNNSKAASLLILLMVASGASATATVEARYVASGLTEACRISLFDTIEKDVLQSREVLVLRSALLFTCLAAWSGDKWHMDMAMGQRGMYLAMLAHSGMLDAADSSFALEQCKQEPEKSWEHWKLQEGKDRLAHSWVIVDQEMSLFSDTTPLLSVVNMHSPMPDADDLWHAESAAEWLDIFEKVHGSRSHSPASVRDYFTSFVDGDLVGKELSPTQLRLLLHPLQAQVCQLRQFITCLPDGGSHAKASRAVSKAATKARLEEISSLLQQWYGISKQSFSGNRGTCWTTCANLIMYHLISLNAITSFKDIEQFGRREVTLGAFRSASWLQMRCIDSPEEAFFHCGQTLRLIRSMPHPVRPPWWAGAVYRVALTGWATSMASGGGRFSPTHALAEPDMPFAIDDLTPENEAITRYIKYQEGTPMLTRSDRSLVSIEVPSNVLQLCIDILDDDCSMRLTDGIKRKLRMFMASWKDQ